MAHTKRAKVRKIRNAGVTGLCSSSVRLLYMFGLGYQWMTGPAVLTHPLGLPARARAEAQLPQVSLRDSSRLYMITATPFTCCTAPILTYAQDTGCSGRVGMN